LAIYPGKQSLKRPKLNEKIDQDIMNVTLEKLDMPPLVPRQSQTGRGASDAVSVSKINHRGVEKYSVSGNTSQIGGNVYNPVGPKDKRRKKLMDFYQAEDDQGCYYSNPIRCSFDDPRLIFEEMCYLCGAFGN
jgi:hypothetical protein